MADLEVRFPSRDFISFLKLNIEAMPFGSPGSEKIVINIDSLWSGGPYSADVSTAIQKREVLLGDS
jgi:hypothetical protein